MGLTDVLFGRKKLKGAARDRLFAISTAQVTLDVDLGLKPGEAAAVVFKPLSAGEIVRAPGIEDQVTGVHLVASELEARGFGPQLLAAVFPFQGAKKVYWIYGFKRGAFWPFVPKGDGKERDNAEELELKAKLEGELPIEQDLSRWFGLFDTPI